MQESKEERRARMRAATFEQYRMMEQLEPVPKPSWTFPSPFVPYAVSTHSREEISWGPQPRTLAELRMYGLSWAIRSKPEWQRKILDQSIMEKWRKEALDQQEGLQVEQKLTKNMVNYVLTELEGYARLSDPLSGIECGPFDAIWYSDRLISTRVSDRLRAAVIELERVPDEMKDWHPGSNGQVLDLVHPSLYCIVYGRTSYADLTRLEPPEYEALQIPDDWVRDRPVPVSDSFCWLPSDFSLVSPYINNLHPTKHKALYSVIETVLSSFINGQEKDLYRDIPPGSGRIKTELTFGTWTGYNSKFAGETVPCIWSKGEVSPEDSMTEAEYHQVQRESPKVLPESFEEYTGELEKTVSPYSLRGKTIQCIIKLANIHLTADNPEYGGGSWHVEAMLNECIVASGIYYYEEENISESRLAFRVTTGAPVYHQQEDDVCMEILYGLKRNSHCCQDLGSIVRARHYILQFPHLCAVALLRGPTHTTPRFPIPLVDPTKPGHRKILAIFLIDPSIDPIPSATISRLNNQTEEYRLKLMKERTGFTQNREEELSYSFNMCEH
ncbi:hypothetical protein B0H13DRAFT_2012690 [Mycena leptocephala]|nr:hypothetical protein B0H13DRAFT_2012690 [Mycena leptocephala]